MDEKTRSDGQTGVMLICAVALIWEFIGRPIVACFHPDLDLPPSLLKEIVAMINLLAGLPI